MKVKTRQIDRVAFEVSPDLKKAVWTAADDEGRTIRQFVSRILVDHLIKKGYLHGSHRQSPN